MKSYIKRGVIFLAASLVVFCVLFVLIQTDVINAYYSQILMVICINIILALSTNLIINYTGQLTLGHSAFMAIGAYASAFIQMNTGLPFFLSLLCGSVVAAVFGFLIGLPTLRLKGDYLAITTLGFCQIVVVAIQNIDALGGAQGLAGIPPKTTFAWVFFSMIATIAILYNIVHANQGRAMISVREDEIAAEAMGIDTTRYKIMSFTTGAFFAGYAGGLYAFLMMFIDPNSFNFLKSIDFVIYVVLGGTGGFVGCIASTSILTLLPEVLRFLGDLRMVIYPLLLIVIMILRVKNIRVTSFLRRKSGAAKPKERGEDHAAA
ncbi:Branched-chain amino acid transport system / permease component [Caprobacter fermentans]|uniref:Branched-chain amino acid ABC transporter permease n=1 Tax=Caproicibacter fermentans TaxID=2576756 RepID=A0A6N8HZ22_9FIRM|nr:branched-chain amino acid ABC transporter permease [Caproicibacter fermentans]MVB10770.1 Branched-chain amino acid transport system / permease component [Caproicibacter fermentans]QNK40807.1 branched-chain amino acid ABC transporter permease [Caproicibacter fermentans]